jgi:tetratricopeptide (TPR) repeat protein
MEQSAPEEMGSLEEATKNAAQLLDVNPTLAAEQAQEILNAIPNHPPAMFLLASARRLSGDPQAALEILEPLLNAQHKWAAAYFEYGASLGMLGRGDEAIKALLKAVQYQPEHPEAWRVLADHLLAIGDTKGGDLAYTRHVQCSARDPMLREAAAAMVKNEVALAERLLKKHLIGKPTDVPAIRMLAEVAVRCGQDEDAEKLLLRCLELAPGFAAARYNLAVILHRRNDPNNALVEIEKALAADSENPSYRNLCAVILSRTGDYDRSIELYSRLLSEYPENAKVWSSYGHVLKTAGKAADSIDAYRQSIERKPSYGEAYWSLANLKTYRFTDTDLAAMHAQLEDMKLVGEDRWHFQFTLGKAYEDAKEYEKSFDHYAKGNALVLHRSGYDPDLNTTRVRELKRAFSQEFLAKREGMGCDASDPIFIVGMPRSGSTLLEQMLACHSQIEGTAELPDILTLAKDLRDEADSDDVAVYAAVLGTKSADELREMGERYLQRTQIYRKSGRPFFIDKMPNNFLHVGMIHLILPNAKIIDARRHPLGCGFSNFKQYYAQGQSFSYGLTEMGRFYYDYVDLMAHFDGVLPGRIHRVFYEDTVGDTESVVRDVLEYCGLDYEPACLRFFESDRPVRTASSEQVRQPIYKAGVEQWKNYEEWLDPLKEALGGVLDTYPDIPKF